MPIIIALPFRPYSGASISKAQAEAVSALVPAKVYNGQTYPVMPQGHTGDRIGADAVRPWVEACIERLGGIPVPGLFVLPDTSAKFAKTLESSLRDWGVPTVLMVPEDTVAHLVKEARNAALGAAIEQATSPADLMGRLAAAAATKEEIAGGIAAYQKRVRDEMAKLLAEMQAAEAAAAEMAKVDASQGTPEGAKAPAPKAKGKAA